MPIARLEAIFICGQIHATSLTVLLVSRQNSLVPNVYLVFINQRQRLILTYSVLLALIETVISAIIQTMSHQLGEDVISVRQGGR
jgi:hypothetical protein